MERGHAESLLPLIERVMSRVAGGFAALNRVAVSIGPGSFTGLRVGLSAGRAIAFATSVPAVGVSTLSAFAAPMIGLDPDMLIASAIDARHGHVYVQMVSGDGRMALSPRIIPVGDAAMALGTGPARIVGSGANLLARAARALGMQPEVGDDLIGPDITWIARLGATAAPEFSPPSPLYLRAADATPQSNGRVALQ